MGVSNIVQEKGKDKVKYRTDKFSYIYENIISFLVIVHYKAIKTKTIKISVKNTK